MGKLIISHTDLDGVASALIIHKYLLETTKESAETILVNYDCAMDVIIEEFSSGRYDEIWIADLSIREPKIFKEMKKYKNDIKTIWIDHHESSVPQDWMDVCIIKESNGECAASLAYKYCKKNLNFDTHHYDYLSRYARDIDLWRQKYSRASDLSMIISVLGPQRLFQILNQNITMLFNFTDVEKRKLL